MTAAASWALFALALAIALVLAIAFLPAIAPRPVERRFRCSECGGLVTARNGRRRAIVAAAMAHRHPGVWTMLTEVDR